MNAAIKRFPRQVPHIWFAVASLIFMLLMGTAVVSAQATPIPIAVGQNQAGTLADAPEPSVQYSLSVDTPQSVEIQVLAITSGLVPRFRILDATGISISEAANSAGVTIAQSIVNFSNPGIYLIEVSSVNNTPGDFLISVQPGAPLLPPEPLVLGELQNGTVDSETTRQAYSFSASGTDVLLATVKSDNPTSGVVVALLDADTGEMFGLSNAQLGGVRYRILTGATNYLLEVTFPGGDEPQTYSVCLETESGSVTCSGGVVPVQPAPVIPPAATPTLDPNGACVVRSAGAASINVRSGPGTGFSVVAQLPFGSSASVIGRLADNSWFQVNVGSVIGWVSASVVTLGGNCTGVGVVTPPPAPSTSSAPTQSPTSGTPMTTTPTATLTPEASGTAPTSTPSATTAPTQDGTPASTIPPVQITAIFTTDQPDLTAEPWGTPIINGNVYLDVRVLNIGVENPGAPFNVTACIGGVLDASGFPTDYCQSQTVDLGSSSGKVITFGVPGTVQGEHPVTVTADSGNVIGESNESNNSSATAMDFH